MPDGSREAEEGRVIPDPAARAADHAAIERLASDLLPALIAKLGTTRLGELEVREGEWRVRLRRPVEHVDASRRIPTERPSRSQPGHEGHGHAPAALEPHGRRTPSPSATAGGNGSSPALAAVGPGRRDSNPNGHGAHGTEAPRSVATSPAVGVFVPASSLTSGLRVRAGDRLGIVDMLGVPQEVVAPADGIVGETLVETGTAVEYGQELIRIELPSATETR